MTARRVVYLVRLCELERPNERILIQKVRLHELDLVEHPTELGAVRGWFAPHDPCDPIALRE